MVNALRSFYPDCRNLEEEINITVHPAALQGAHHGRHVLQDLTGHTVVYPRSDLTYCANFLNMMFDSPVQAYELDPDVVKALNVFLILHADHEQNCSTAAVRGGRQRPGEPVRGHLGRHRGLVGTVARRRQPGP